MSLKDPNHEREVQMHQAPQQTRPVRSDLTAATTRAQYVLRSMRAPVSASTPSTSLPSRGRNRGSSQMDTGTH